MSAPSMTASELDALPVTVDLVTSARAFGIGREKAYEMARAGEFPVRVLRLGRKWRVVRADLFAALGHQPAVVPASSA